MKLTPLSNLKDIMRDPKDIHNHLSKALEISGEQALTLLSNLDRWKAGAPSVNLESEKSIERFEKEIVSYILKMYWLGRDDKFSAEWKSILESISTKFLSKDANFNPKIRSEPRIHYVDYETSIKQSEMVWSGLWNAYKEAGGLDSMSKPKKSSFISKMFNGNR